MSEVILFGEPMALFIANSEGALEEVEQFTRALSGAEVNVSIGLTRLGHEVSYITRLGDDSLGHYIANCLKRESINTEFIKFDREFKTGIQLKNKVRSGDPSINYYRKGSATSHISVKDMDEIDFSGIKLVHITGIPPALSLSCREATYRLIQRAREKQVFISFDPNLRPTLWESKEEMCQVINDIASYCDMILPGVSEGLTLMGSNEPEKIADYYQSLGVKTIVIKMGAKGAYVREESATYFVPGFRVEKVVDTVGAGDGFAVGVLSGVLEGLPMAEAVIRGNAIGSIQVMNVSDNAGLPTKRELEEYIKANSSVQ